MHTWYMNITILYNLNEKVTTIYISPSCVDLHLFPVLALAFSLPPSIFPPSLHLSLSLFFFQLLIVCIETYIYMRGPR